MSVLSEIIDGASGDEVGTGTLLRKALVVATRLQSADLRNWVKAELDGYDRRYPDSLPSYRGPFALQANGLFVNEYGSVQVQHQLSSASVADSKIRSYLFDIRFFHPLTELENLANTRIDNSANPTVAWDQAKVQVWNSLIASGDVPRPGDLFLFSAHQAVTQSFLSGIVDRVRSTLLTLMLDLESADPDTGSVDGPTMANPAVANAVHSNIIQINNYGSNNSVSLDKGEMTTGTSVVVSGDIRSFISAAAPYLSDDGLVELREAATAIPEERETRLRRFLQRVEEGAIKVASNVGVDVASQNLATLVGQFLGGG